jgi:hypothetical protein
MELTRDLGCQLDVNLKIAKTLGIEIHRQTTLIGILARLPTRPPMCEPTTRQRRTRISANVDVRYRR